MDGSRSQETMPAGGDATQRDGDGDGERKCSKGQGCVRETKVADFRLA